MHWLNYSLLATILWAAYGQNSVVQAEVSNNTEGITLTADPKENEVFPQSLEPELTSTDVTVKAENHKEASSSVNVTTPGEDSMKLGEKRDVENITFNDIKPFFLFPILPYLFPPREEENPNSGNGDHSTTKNETEKIEGNPAEMKPFIFFDFAFNIRRIPISNVTDKLNDSKIINVKKLSISERADDSKSDIMKNRRRRNTKMDTPGFFDDAPLFPDSELDEFLPKPDLFFPDLPFHHKPAKKLSRRKRDQKKSELKNDLKSFFDAFDEAFMRTKRELEWTDPILNFLRGGEPSFDEEKKEADDLFNQLPEIQEKPGVKWRIQKNIKGLNDRQVGLPKVQDSPTFIVDKVVKIGEFHVHDDGHDKTKKKKRGLIDSKRNFLGHDNHDEIISSKHDSDIPRSIFELIKQEGSKRKKRVHPKISNSEEEISKKTESREVKSSPQTNEPILPINAKRNAGEGHKADTNNTEKLINLMKMFDVLKGKMEVELRKTVQDNMKMYDTVKIQEGSKSMFQDGIKKNLTDLLKQFLELNKNLEEPKVKEKSGLNERDDGRLFDWAEKETIQNSNILEKNKRERRQKKDYLEVDTSSPANKDTEQQIADLNYMFLNITVPTVMVVGVILLICFLSLQTKGRICMGLFQPRQVLVLNDEAATQLKNPRTKKDSTPQKGILEYRIMFTRLPQLNDFPLILHGICYARK